MTTSLNARCMGILAKPSNKTTSKRKFAFQTFSERISHITVMPYPEGEIGAMVQIEEVHHTSYLHRTILHWQEICCSVDFSAFALKALPLCQNLSQLILHADVLVETLQESMTNLNVFSVDALSHCVVAIARDLSADFFQYFESTVETFVSVLDNCAGLEASQVEVIFRCLATICNVLRRCGQIEVCDIIRKSERIRYHSKHFIRKFAAMVIALSIRTSAESSILMSLKSVLAECDGYEAQNMVDPTKMEAATLLIYFSICGHSGSHLHSKALLILRNLFDPKFAIDVRITTRICIMKSIIHSLGLGITKERFREMLAMLLEHVERFTPKKNIHSTRVHARTYLTEMIVSIVEAKLLIRESKNDLRILSNFLEASVLCTLSSRTNQDVWLPFVSATSRLMSSLISDGIICELDLVGKIPWCDYVSSLDGTNLQLVVLALFKGLQSNSKFLKDACLCVVLDVGCIILLKGFEYFTLLSGIVRYLQEDGRAFRFRSDFAIDKDLKQICSQYESHSNTKWAVIQLIPHFLSKEDALQILNAWVSYFVESTMRESMSMSLDDLAMIVSVLEARIQLRYLYSLSDWSTDVKLINLALSTRLDISCAILLKLERLLSFETSRKLELPKNIYDACVENLTSRNRLTRLAALRILGSNFGEKDDDGFLEQFISTFVYINGISNEGINMLDYSRKSVNLIQMLCQKISTLSVQSRFLLMRMALGTIHLRFAYIWKPLVKLIGLLASSDTGIFEILKVELSSAKLCLFENTGGMGHTICGNSSSQQLYDDVHDIINPNEQSVDVKQWIDNLISALECTIKIKAHACFALELFFEVFNSSLSGRYDFVDTRYSTTIIATLKLLHQTDTISFVVQDEGKTPHGKDHNMIAAFRLLSGDRNENIACGALKCLELCKLESLSALRIKQLCLLAQPSSLKKGLSTISFEGGDLNSSPEFPAIDPYHRETTVDAIVQVLLKYITGTGKKFKILRPIILNWFTCLDVSEVRPVMCAILRPVMPTELSTLLLSTSKPDDIREMSVSAIKNAKKYEILSSILHLREVLKVIPNHFQCYANVIVVVVFQIFGLACKELSAWECPEDDEFHQLKCIRTQSLRLLASMIPLCTAEAVEHEWVLAQEYLGRIALQLSSECSGTEIPPILDLIVSIVNNEHLFPLFDIGESLTLLDSVFRILTCPNTSTGCRKIIFGVLSQMAECACTNGNPLDGYHRVVIALSEHIVNCLQGSLHTQVESGCFAKMLSMRTEPNEIDLLLKLRKISDKYKWGIRLFDDVLVATCRTRLNDSKRADALGMLHSMIADIDFSQEQISVYIDQLSLLLSKVHARHARVILLRVLQDLCQLEPRMSQTIKLVTSLNSYSDTHLDEVDHNTRLQAYTILMEIFDGDVDEVSFTLYINQALSDVKDNDAILQNSAKSFMYRCLDFGAHFGETAMLCKKTILCVLLPGIARLLNHINDLVRNCAIKVIRHAVLAEYIPELRKLCDDNEDVDIFLNLSHIQAHRRAKALRDLCNPGTEKVLKTESFRNYVLPIMIALLCDTSTDVATTAATCVGSSSQELDSETYLRTLCDLVKRSPVHASSFHYRAAACMLDKYPFKPMTSCGLHAESRSQSQMHQEVVEILHHVVLPQVELNIVTKTTHFNSTKVETIHNVLASCLASIVSLLDAKYFQEALIRVLKLISAHMSSRHQKSRDSAMKAIKCFVNKLGERCVPTIIQALVNSLNSGVQLQFLGKALHVALSNCTDLSSEVAMDVFKRVIPSLQSNLFGNARDHREICSGKLPSEAKSRYSLETISLLASIFTEQNDLAYFFSTILHILPTNPDVRNRKCCGNVLHAIREGLLKNSNLRCEQIIIIACSLIEERLKIERDTSVQVSDWSCHLEYSTQMTNFAMDLLHVATKRISNCDLESSNICILPIKSVMQLMLRCLNSSFYDVQVGASKVLLKLLRLKFCTFGEFLKDLEKRAIGVLKSTSGAEDILAQNSLSILARLIKHGDTSTLTLTKLTFVTSFAFKDLRSHPARKPSFSLLIALISRRVTFSGMYALMDEVIVLITRGSSEELRNMCSYVTIQFLLLYPIGERQMNRMLKSLITSLDYPHENGRLSALNTLHGIILGFPAEALRMHSAALFLPLVLRIATDDVMKCRKLAATVLRFLFSRLDTAHVKQFLSCIEIWSERTDCLKQAAHQVLLIGFEEQPSITFDIFLRLESAMLSTITAIALEDNQAKKWSTLYCLMECFERALSLEENRIEYISCLDGLCEILPQILHYGHVWVQSSAIRLIKLCSIRKDKRISPGSRLYETTLMNKWALLEGVVMHLEQQTQVQAAIQSLEMEDVVSCLTSLTDDLLGAYGGVHDRFEKLFIRLRQLTVSASGVITTAILKWLAKLICVKRPHSDVDEYLYFHSSLICHIYLKRNDNAKQKSNIALAKEIFSAISEIMPSESFSEILQKVQSHESVIKHVNRVN